MCSKFSVWALSVGLTVIQAGAIIAGTERAASDGPAKGATATRRICVGISEMLAKRFTGVNVGRSVTGPYSVHVALLRRELPAIYRSALRGIVAGEYFSDSNIPEGLVDRARSFLKRLELSGSFGKTEYREFWMLMAAFSKTMHPGSDANSFVSILVGGWPNIPAVPVFYRDSSRFMFDSVLVRILSADVLVLVNSPSGFQLGASLAVLRLVEFRNSHDPRDRVLSPRLEDIADWLQILASRVDASLPVWNEIMQMPRERQELVIRILFAYYFTINGDQMETLRTWKNIPSIIRNLLALTGRSRDIAAAVNFVIRNSDRLPLP